MRAIVVIVAKVMGKKSFQVSLVHRDDGIEQITAAAFHPALTIHPSHFAITGIGSVLVSDAFARS
jgi:hypothetical protein